MRVLSHNTLIPIGLVLTLCGVVFSAGILYNRVDANDNSLTEFKQDTKENFQALNEKIDRLITTPKNVALGLN